VILNLSAETRVGGYSHHSPVRPVLRHSEIVSEVAEGVLIPIKLDSLMTVHGLDEGYDGEFALSWSFIRPGDVVVAAGANIGIWTIGAANPQPIQPGF
jgi:hypothetical protein